MKNYIKVKMKLFLVLGHHINHLIMIYLRIKDHSYNVTYFKNIFKKLTL